MLRQEVEPIGQQTLPQTCSFRQQTLFPGLPMQKRPLQHFWRLQPWPAVAQVAAWASPLLPESQPTPGMEATAPPRRAPPSKRSAWPREMPPLASPLARASKDRSRLVQSVHSPWVVTSPFRSSAAMTLLPPNKNRPPALGSRLRHWLHPPQAPTFGGRDSQPLPSSYFFVTWPAYSYPRREAIELRSP